MKKFLSVLLLMTMLLSAMVIAPAATSEAATNAATSFRSGKLLKVNGYYFSNVFNEKKQAYYLLRTKSNGTGTTVVGKGTTLTGIYAYKNVVYFSANNKIYAHNAKTLKTSVLRKTDYQIKGICTAGLICNKYNEPLYILNYKGRFKKIGTKSDHFLAATNTDVFISRSLNLYKKDGNPCEDIRVYRYNIKKAKATVCGKFTSWGSYYDKPAAAPKDFHVFSKKIIFTYGSVSGSVSDFTGHVYAMNTDGSGIKVVRERVESRISPGSSCVYVYEKNDRTGAKTVYRISEKGAVTGKANNDNFLSTTASDYTANSYKHNPEASYPSTDLWVSPRIRGINGTRVLDGTRFVLSSDPKDTCANMNVNDSYGNLFLVTVDVRTFHQTNYKGRNVRAKYYLVNARTAKAYKLA